MKEYFGDKAKNYSQSSGNLIILNPSLIDEIPIAKNKDCTFLDIACGNGIFFEIATKKGYKYTGTDASQDLLDMASKNFPNGSFIQDDARILSKIQGKFDVILISMLFTAFNNIKDIEYTLRNASLLLKNDGSLIIGTAHPAYDPYMQSGMLNREDVKANFTTYFESGSQFVVTKNINGKDFTFEDYHWTLSDYINTVIKAGLNIVNINECKPDKSKKDINPQYYEKKKHMPTFLIIKCSLQQ